MRVIALRALRTFWDAHPDAREPLQAWYHDALQATWTSPSDVKARYRNASIIPGNRLVFNVKGNRYRIVVMVHYNKGIVYFRFVGTHQEYDDVDAASI